MHLYLNFSKRYPALFCLINNKNKEGYKEVFKDIKNIITIENSVKINLKSITMDFERGLIEAFKENFPDVIVTGCYYHYMNNIYYILYNLHINK